MKSKFVRVFKIIAILVLSIIVAINITIFIIRRYGMTDLETRKFNMLISGVNTISPPGELSYALQWYSNWDNIFLSDNFKKKFKKRKGIIKNISELNNISGFFDRNYIPGTKLIGVYGTVKKSIIDILNINYIEIDRAYYFRYKVDDNGYLDDIELVGQQDFDAETGFPIGVDDSNYHTIS